MGHSDFGANIAETMNPFARVLVLGCLAVVSYDAIASIASRFAGFYYGRAAIGSFIVYAIVGFFAAESAVRNRLLFALLAGLLLGLTDSSLGWLVSILIGPGRPKAKITPYLWSIVSFRVTMKAGLISALGALPALVK